MKRKASISELVGKMKKFRVSTLKGGGRVTKIKITGVMKHPKYGVVGSLNYAASAGDKKVGLVSHKKK